MFKFPKGVYVDIRIENLFETSIQKTLGRLEEFKERRYSGAFIRLFDGKRWYYSSTTDIENIQKEIDELHKISSPNDEINEHPISIKNSEKTLKELLNGKKGILVFIASSGDFSPDGKFGIPVQLGFLYDGEKLIGRVPEFKLNSDIYSMFSKDFIGVGKDSITQLDKNFGVVINMKIMK